MGAFLQLALAKSIYDENYSCFFFIYLFIFIFTFTRQVLLLASFWKRELSETQLKLPFASGDSQTESLLSGYRYVLVAC